MPETRTAVKESSLVSAEQLGPS